MDLTTYERLVRFSTDDPAAFSRAVLYMFDHRKKGGHATRASFGGDLLTGLADGVPPEIRHIIVGILAAEAAGDEDAFLAVVHLALVNKTLAADLRPLLEKLHTRVDVRAVAARSVALYFPSTARDLWIDTLGNYSPLAADAWRFLLREGSVQRPLVLDVMRAMHDVFHDAAVFLAPNGGLDPLASFVFYLARSLQEETDTLAGPSRRAFETLFDWLLTNAGDGLLDDAVAVACGLEDTLVLRSEMRWASLALVDTDRNDLAGRLAPLAGDDQLLGGDPRLTLTVAESLRDYARDPETALFFERLERAHIAPVPRMMALMHADTSGVVARHLVPAWAFYELMRPRYENPHGPTNRPLSALAIVYAAVKHLGGGESADALHYMKGVFKLVFFALARPAAVLRYFAHALGECLDILGGIVSPATAVATVFHCAATATIAQCNLPFFRHVTDRFRDQAAAIVAETVPFGHIGPDNFMLLYRVLFDAPIFARTAAASEAQVHFFDALLPFLPRPDLFPWSSFQRTVVTTPCYVSPAVLDRPFFRDHLAPAMREQYAQQARIMRGALRFDAFLAEEGLSPNPVQLGRVTRPVLVQLQLFAQCLVSPDDARQLHAYANGLDVPEDLRETARRVVKIVASARADRADALWAVVAPLVVTPHRLWETEEESIAEFLAALRYPWRALSFLRDKPTTLESNAYLTSIVTQFDAKRPSLSSAIFYSDALYLLLERVPETDVSQIMDEVVARLSELPPGQRHWNSVIYERVYRLRRLFHTTT